MDLITFRELYPQAAFIDDEDVQRELNAGKVIDIDSMCTFYTALYSGGH